MTSFTAPDENSIITFRLTIWDDDINESTDEVTIIVAFSGCMNEEALNFNSVANESDGSCLFAGCVDEDWATNYYNDGFDCAGDPGEADQSCCTYAPDALEISFSYEISVAEPVIYVTASWAGSDSYSCSVNGSDAVSCESGFEFNSDFNTEGILTVTTDNGARSANEFGSWGEIITFDNDAIFNLVDMPLPSVNSIDVTNGADGCIDVAFTEEYSYNGVTVTLGNQQVIDANSPTTFCGLQAGTSYEASVTSLNQIGSDTATGTASTTSFTENQINILESISTEFSITVSFSEAENYGGDATWIYTVCANEFCNSSPNTTITITGLTPGSAYEITIISESQYGLIFSDIFSTSTIYIGCMNNEAHNFEPEATVESGDCILGPTILSIYDTPEDNGGEVFVNWERNNLDTIPNNSISQYSLWRYIPNQNSEENITNNRGWEFLDYIDAYAFEDYSYSAPTILTSNMADSVLIPEFTWFKILAHTDNQSIFYPSQIDSGFSIDNILPSAPQNFNIQNFEDHNLLSWSNNSNDISHFDIYRNNQFLATTTDLLYMDYDIRSTDFSYTLEAWDINGNVNVLGSTTALTTYSLPYGNSLISFRGNLPTTNTQEYVESIGDVEFIIGQGVGLFNTAEGWSGNLNELDPFSGYWINLSSEKTWSTSMEGGYLDPCTQYQLSFGNNLLSYLGDNQSTISALGGNQLSQHFPFIIGQGVGLFNTVDGWSGNLNNLEPKKGYWLNVSSTYPWYISGEGSPFRWNINNGCEDPDISLVKDQLETYSSIPTEFRFIQSTNQAFYLINEIIIDGKQAEEDDLILAYHNDILVGSAMVNPNMTVLPVMGRDASAQTEGFLEEGELPTLRLVKANGESIPLEAILEGFRNLLVSEVASVTGSTIVIPTEYALYPAFPNPFNPVTTISFGVPETLHAKSLQIFDINGRFIETLIDGQIEAGFHTIEWNADGLPRGVYFVKLDVGDPSVNSGQGFTQTQKLMLVK
jgi:hypothetical protein